MQHEIPSEEFFEAVSKHIDAYGACNSCNILEELTKRGYVIVKKVQNEKS